MSDLIQIVFDEVEGAFNTIKQQADMADQLKSALDAQVASAITGGDWKGDGANAFGDDVRTKLLPEIAALVASIAGFGGSLMTGLDIFSQADDLASNVVSGIVDTFNIF